MNGAKYNKVVAYTLAFLVLKPPGTRPEKKVEGCATMKQTYNDLFGKCACELPKQMEDRNCKCYQSEGMVYIFRHAKKPTLSVIFSPQIVFSSLLMPLRASPHLLKKTERLYQQTNPKYSIC